MSAYATLRKAFPQQALQAVPEQAELGTHNAVDTTRSADDESPQLIDILIDRLADRVATALAQRLAAPTAQADAEWLDSRAAAEYLGLHRDTLRRLAAERAIPAEQDAPGCKLFFRRPDLDEWRTAGGRANHLAAELARVA
jgi:excisionase family DNA binding protein